MIPIGKRLDLLKIIAHPVRIKILEELLQGVKCVSDFEETLDISQPNISQHLSLLRMHGIVDFFIDGRLKCYFLKEPFIPDLLELLKKEYEDDIPAPACCPHTAPGRNVPPPRYPGACVLPGDQKGEISRRKEAVIRALGVRSKK